VGNRAGVDFMTNIGKSIINERGSGKKGRQTHLGKGGREGPEAARKCVSQREEYGGGGDGASVNNPGGAGGSLGVRQAT